MALPPFIKPIHPKTAIKADPAAIARVLRAGWVGQAKIHGHRAQIHIPADPHEEITLYTRQGGFHKKKLPGAMALELRRLFSPQEGWNVVDAEWVKGRDVLFVFDYLKYNDRLLSDYSFIDRYELLPRVYSSECVTTLPLLRTVEQCMMVLADQDPEIEGLVFRSLSSTGFQDTAIIRCRKGSIFYGQ